MIVVTSVRAREAKAAAEAATGKYRVGDVADQSAGHGPLPSAYLDPEAVPSSFGTQRGDSVLSQWPGWPLLPLDDVDDQRIVGVQFVDLAPPAQRLGSSVAHGTWSCELLLAATINCYIRDRRKQRSDRGPGHLPGSNMVAKPHGWSSAMYEWSTRMLLKHYLDQGLTKTELSRRVGVSRRTIHDWIASGQLDRDLATGQTCYLPRPTEAGKLDPYKGIIEARFQEFSDAQCTAAVRRDQRGRLRARLQPGQGLRMHGATEGAARFRPCPLRRPPDVKDKWTSAASCCRGAGATRWW